MFVEVDRPGQESLTLKITTKGVETSVTTTNTNSPSQDYTNLDDQLPQTCRNINVSIKLVTLSSTSPNNEEFL